MDDKKNKRQAAQSGAGEFIKNKRQVYIWPENIEFYDELKNKSKLINLLIRKYKQSINYDKSED